MIDHQLIQVGHRNRPALTASLALPRGRAAGMVAVFLTLAGRP
jgi:hypothetical protein